MKLSNSMPSQVNVRIVEIKLNRLYNLKLPVFKFSGQRTNHSENEQIYLSSQLCQGGVHLQISIQSHII